MAGLPYVFSYIYLISLSSIVYAFYPIKFRSIERRGFSNLLTEHACINKILYFEIPILFAIMTMFVLVYNSDPAGPIHQSIINFFYIIGQPFSEYSVRVTFPYSPVTETTFTTDSVGAEYASSIIFNGIMINLTFSVTAGIVWLVLVAVRKELAYYLAKSLFQTVTREQEESRKAEYLIKATKIYDKYLRRTLNLEINDVKKIYSKILSDPNLNKNESMRLISESFQSNDKLEPIKFLSKILNVKDTDTFLVDESIGKKLKDMAIFFATIFLW